MTLDLHEAAARSGGHCWVERRLFEVLGSWVADAGTPAVAILFDRLSQHAAWRAEQWWARLPVLAGVDRDGLVAAPPGWPELAGATGPAGAAASDLDRVGRAARELLPRLAVRYARHLDEVTPAADGSVARTLRQAGADVAADWLDACRVLDELGGLGGAPTAPALP